MNIAVVICAIVLSISSVEGRQRISITNRHRIRGSVNIFNKSVQGVSKKRKKNGKMSGEVNPQDDAVMQVEQKRVLFSHLNSAQSVTTCSVPSALGNALLTYENMNLCIHLTYSGLSGNEVVSHIHGPAMVGEDGDVLFTLTNNATKVECFTLDSTQENFLINQKLYFNVHTDACPSGEIRGQILLDT